MQLRRRRPGRRAGGAREDAPEPPARRRRLRWLRAVVVDTGPLRESRDYRLLAVGGFVSGLGTQVTLVALPFQVYVLTGSSFDVGLIGLAELLPLVALSLIGGALADRTERRRLLLAAQLVQLSTSALLAVGAATGPPPVAALYVLAGIAAAASAVDRPTRTAMIPGLVAPEQLQPAVSFNYGLAQLTMVVGPAAGGIVIAAAGLRWAYTLDVATFAAMVTAVGLMRRQPPPAGHAEESFLRAVRSGLRFAAGRGELMGSFAADILAMTFGMPRALFPALSLTLYHAGATGVGLLYAALSFGATVSALSTGWLGRVRRLGRIVVIAIAGWGAAVTLAGLTHTLAVAMVCLAVAGAADSVSAVCRSSILLMATPDAMRGRMSAIFTLVVTGGPRLGDVESGSVAALFGAQAAVASGGILCVLGLAPIVAAFPAFWRYGETAPTPAE
jgi:MFS family permease